MTKYILPSLSYGSYESSILLMVGSSILMANLSLSMLRRFSQLLKNELLKFSSKFQTCGPLVASVPRASMAEEFKKLENASRSQFHSHTSQSASLCFRSRFAPLARGNPQGLFCVVSGWRREMWKNWHITKTVFPSLDSTCAECRWCNFCSCLTTSMHSG